MGYIVRVKYGDIYMKLYINTFGGFDVKAGEQPILKETTRTYKLNKLFQYFLTFRNKKLLPETIIDNLFFDSESSDPKNTLRTQIFRLRHSINTLVPEGIENNYVNIYFINGYYCLELGENAVLDVDEFEKLIERGNALCEEDGDGAIELYQKAISIYKGLYLSEYAYEVWLVPARNYYRRLYLKTLYKLVELLKEKQDNEAIVSLCEHALLVEPYEEEIHISLVDAMIALGQNKSAMRHYEHTVSLLEKEMGANPSAKFTDLQRKIQNTSSNKAEIGILEVKNKLDEPGKGGAMCCEFEYFKFMFNVQKRKALRNDESDYFGLITLRHEINRNYDAREMTMWSNSMRKLLESSLRKGDVFTFWNDCQILIMLHNVRGDGISIIKERIRKNMKTYNNLNTNVSMMFQPLTSEDIVI
jgi:two-component SAPR family response regulator